MKLTLYKYITNEIWPTFGASLAVTVFVIVATKMLSIMEMVVSKGVFVGHVVRMVLYLLPEIIVFALPAACLIAVVVAFLRLSVDSEIIALKSSGVSLYQLLPPVAALSAAGCAAALALGVFAVPWGNSSFTGLIFEIGRSQATLGIKERVFSEPFDDVAFYVNRFSAKDRVMKDVFVVDRRDKAVTHTVVAERGRIVSRPGRRAITLHFEHGTIFMVDKDLASARSIRFTSYDLNIGLDDIMSSLASRKRAPREMGLKELSGALDTAPRGEQRYNELLIELHERFSMALAVFLMGMIGAPLGAQIRARGRSAGIGISLAVFMVYYVCLAAARSFCESGTVHPVVGVWIPDLFLAGMCVFLLRRSARERSFNLFEGFRVRAARG